MCFALFMLTCHLHFRRQMCGKRLNELQFFLQCGSWATITEMHPSAELGSRVRTICATCATCATCTWRRRLIVAHNLTATCYQCEAVGHSMMKTQSKPNATLQSPSPSCTDILKNLTQTKWLKAKAIQSHKPAALTKTSVWRNKELRKIIQMSEKEKRVNVLVFVDLINMLKKVMLHI